MRVVILIDGSVFASDLNARCVEDYASVVRTLTQNGYGIGVVVSGGGVARGYIGAARGLGTNEV